MTVWLGGCFVLCDGWAKKWMYVCRCEVPLGVVVAFKLWMGGLRVNYVAKFSF